MAEILGIASGIVTIAESCLKIGSSLWKVGKSLQMAGHNVREISKKVTLTAKTLRQIAPKLEPDRVSVKDLCLIQEVRSVCEERVVEANQLLSVLEAEINHNGSNVRALLARIKFILERSKFVLLERDLNSLLITLQLLVGVMNYEEIRLSRQLSDEIEQDLQSLKEVVEQDILYHKADKLMQYMLTSDSQSPRGEGFGHTNDHAECTALDLTSSGAVSNSANLYSIHDQQRLPVLPSDTGGLGSVAVQNILQIDINKTLEVFTQTQYVQKQAVRRAEEELESSDNTTHNLPLHNRTAHAAMPPTTSVFGTSNHSDNISSRRVSTAETIDSGIESTFSSDRSQAQSSNTDYNRYTISSFDFERTPVHKITRDSTHRVAPVLTRTANDSDVNFQRLSINSSSVADSSNDEIRLTIKNISKRHGHRIFRLQDIKGKANAIKFSTLESQDLHHLVKDSNRWLLDIKPPPNGSDSSTDFRIYAPPSKPSIGVPGKMALLSSESRRASKDYERRRRYILEYALWYTAECKWHAIQQQHYVFCDSCGTILDPMKACAEDWIAWLKPEMHIKVILRGLDTLSFKTEGKNYQVVDRPEYAKDVEDAFNVQAPSRR